MRSAKNLIAMHLKDQQQEEKPAKKFQLLTPKLR
jgi:hypothetical protein